MIGCYDRAAEGSRGTIMIYLRLHFGGSLRCNANARHWNVFIVPLFPLWIIGAFCVKDSEYNDTTFTDAPRMVMRAFTCVCPINCSSSVLSFYGRRCGKLPLMDVNMECVSRGERFFFCFPSGGGIVIQWGVGLVARVRRAWISFSLLGKCEIFGGFIVGIVV